jgi:transcriptional regulator with XRE-family HTH domain
LSDILLYIDSPGTLIREYRRRAGISQASLARRAGTTQAAVSRIERGLTTPTWETVQALALGLGCDANLNLTPLTGRWDPVHMAQLRARPPSERLALAMSANLLAGRLRQAGARARA